MRVISQDGNVDLLYENVVVFKVGNTVMARCDGFEYTLGAYSAKEKAIKAMEMLRKAYGNNEFYHYTSATNTFEKAVSYLSREEFKEVTAEYFQFPQDDEIEV